jgi:hypothetical protein
MQHPRVVVGPDLHAPLGVDRPGIEAFIHLHDRNSGLRVAGQQSALNGSRATPTRQQRGVNIDRATGRQIENLRGQHQTVGGDDEHVRPRLAQPRQRICAP